MRCLILAFITAVTFMSAPVAAFDGKTTLGFGRLFTNDAMGDGQDRWRSGSYAISWLRGRDWNGDLPASFGEILQYHAMAEIISPESLTRPRAGDRTYAGVVTLGVHTHFRQRNAEIAIGADIVAIGPMTGIGGFQRFAHEILGAPVPTTVLDTQLGNQLIPTLRAEVGRSFGSGMMRFRPFLAAEAGAETFLRAGADLMIGQFEQGALMLRDPVSGQRYSGIKGDARGFGAVVGGDIAAMASSAYFPAGGAQMRSTRTRLRAGFQWQGERAGVFYGATYLGPEYVGQPSGQVLGSLQIRVSF